jgi:thiaminase (transcriptional activator TenA)
MDGEGLVENRFTERLLQQTAEIWQRVHAHPFVTGLGDGTLPVESFRFYMVQDYLFLIDFCRVLALGAAKSPDIETMGRFAGLLHETLDTEMGLHRAYAARFGITDEVLESAQLEPATHAYTRHLLHAAQSGTLGELAAALLPCQWSYAQIGQALARSAPRPLHALYGDWIEAYASSAFGALAAWLSDLVDRLAAVAGPAERTRMAQHYRDSSRYELLFWEAALKREMWQV